MGKTDLLILTDCGKKSGFIPQPPCKEQWNHIQSLVRDGYLYNPGTEPLTYATMGDVIAETAHKYPDRVAVRSVHEDLSITYEQLLTQADSLGCALRAQGLQKGDRFGLWTHNCAAWIVAVVAAARSGLISVLINPMYEKDELCFCIKKTEMKGLMIGDRLPNKDYYKVLTQLVPELHNDTPGELKSQRFPSLTSLITSGKEQLPGATLYDSLITKYQNSGDISLYGNEVIPEDGSIIHFTSGTTGEPKAALDSHLGVVNNTYFSGKRNDFHLGHQKICVQVPLFHALGSIITVLAGLRHGSTIVLASPTYSVSANINTLYNEKCTIVTGTPTMFVDLLTQIRQRASAPPALRVALSAGAPCSPQLIRDIQQYMKAESVKVLYGMTETTACVFQSYPGDSIDVVAETVGFLQDHVEAKVVDKNGKLLPFGSPGELVVRGYNNMICYWNEPDKTNQVLSRDGWLRTGDKFIISEDGYGRIVGRLKDIIVRGGENIAPKEIEDLINTHPHVVESQVVGVPDARLGEELCAVVRLRDGTSLTTTELHAHLTGRIAKFKIPKLLKITDTFPKTTSGKIQKFKIIEMIKAGII